MNWTLWWVFATTGMVLYLTPGLAVLLVLATALNFGARRGIASILGILAANALYFAVSATSVGAILTASSSMFFFAKWIGAGYLLYLGLRTLFASTSVLAGAGGAGSGGSAGKLFGGAFLTQMSNPKALVFFAAFVPQFIDARFPLVRQMVILGITSEALEFCVLLGYAIAAARAANIAHHPRYAVWTNRVAGLLLILAATGMALLRRG